MDFGFKVLRLYSSFLKHTTFKSAMTRLVVLFIYLLDTSRSESELPVSSMDHVRARQVVGPSKSMLMSFTFLEDACYMGHDTHPRQGWEGKEVGAVASKATWHFWTGPVSPTIPAARLECARNLTCHGGKSFVSSRV